MATNQGSTDPRVEELIRDGINAAKAGDHITARAKLREAVVLDQFSEKGWYWLATVVETEEERRVCLGNVLVINPNNYRAQQMLDRLNDPKRARAKSGGVPPEMRRAGLIVGIVVALLLLLVVLLFRGGGDTPAATPTSAAVLPSETPTPNDLAVTLTADALATIARRTRLAEINRSLPPTWTPAPTFTPRGTQTATPMAGPPPGLLAGRLVIVEGKPLTLDGYLPLKLLDLATGEKRDLTPGDRGDYGLLSPNGQRLIYSRLVSGARAQLIMREQNLNGTQPIEINSRWGYQPALADQEMLALSADGKTLVFVARNVIGENERTRGIYALPVNYPLPGQDPTPTEPPTFTPDPNATIEAPTPEQTPTARPTVQVTRVTKKDDGDNTWPDISPDGQTIVFTSDRSMLGEDGTDIYLIPLAGGTPTRLTQDGSEFTEAEPRWSPDGRQIVFAAAPKGKKEHDLYLMDAGGGNRRMIVTGGNNIRPHWSPDGRFIVYASTRTNKWELFVFEVATGNVYQLTATSDTIFVTDWAP